MNVLITKKISMHEPCLCSFLKNSTFKVFIEKCTSNCVCAELNKSGVRIILKDSKGTQQCMTPSIFRYFLKEDYLKIIKN